MYSGNTIRIAVDDERITRVDPSRIHHPKSQPFTADLRADGRALSVACPDGSRNLASSPVDSSQSARWSVRSELTHSVQQVALAEQLGGLRGGRTTRVDVGTDFEQHPDNGVLALEYRSGQR